MTTDDKVVIKYLKFVMKIHILTLFPAYFSGVLTTSMISRAIAHRAVEVEVINIRDYAFDKHHVTDDRPFGGGPGMVMKVEPIARALAAIQHPHNQHLTILTSARGRRFSQQLAHDYATLDDLTIICGHYEGVDQRVGDHLVDEEVRVGDYVLTGGEPAASVILDAVTRLLPGSLGNDASHNMESHTYPGLGGYPQYTRPEKFRSWRVPSVLLSGHHADIAKWRHQQRKLIEQSSEES